MTRTAAVGTSTALTRFDSVDPRTGAVVGSHEVADEAAVRAAVAQARVVARWWGGLGFAERRRRLTAWRARLAQRLDELAAVVSAETGKPGDDARLEVVLVVGHLDWGCTTRSACSAGARSRRACSC